LPVGFDILYFTGSSEEFVSCLTKAESHLQFNFLKFEKLVSAKEKQVAEALSKR
jgi:hypothetical protein